MTKVHYKRPGLDMSTGMVKGVVVNSDTRMGLYLLIDASGALELDESMAFAIPGVGLIATTSM